MIGAIVFPDGSCICAECVEERGTMPCDLIGDGDEEWVGEPGECRACGAAPAPSVCVEVHASAPSCATAAPAVCSRSTRRVLVSPWIRLMALGAALAALAGCAAPDGAEDAAEAPSAVVAGPRIVTLAVFDRSLVAPTVDAATEWWTVCRYSVRVTGAPGAIAVVLGTSDAPDVIAVPDTSEPRLVREMARVLDVPAPRGEHVTAEDCQ